MLIDSKPNLLLSHRTHHVMVEFTRDCNMRCTYCAVSNPDWKPISLNLSYLNDIIPVLQNRQTIIANLHGHGETTMIDGWHSYADRFSEAGMGLSICTNLSRDYSEKELQTLAKFVSITISLDTVEPQLFRKLRRGGDLRQLIFNMTRIQALAKEYDRNIRWIWSCVIVDKTIDGMLDLIKYGVSLGVSVFCFCNLTKLPTPDGGVDLKHLSELSPEDSRKALNMIEHSREYCKSNQVIFDIKAGLEDSLRAKING